MLNALYLRKSRQDSKDETIQETLAKHERALWKLINELNIDKNSVVVFKEVVSGDSISQRPEMIKLLDGVCEGIFENVIVMDVQRLARGDTIDQGQILRAFALHNTKIITPGKVINLENEYDEEFFEYDLFVGRREYKKITARLKRGKLQAVQEGSYQGSIAPYGYKKVVVNKTHTLEIVEEEAKIIRKIFDLFLYENLGTTNIAKYLNDLGVKPRNCNQWTPAIVRGKLTNNVYCGIIKWNQRKIVKIYKNKEIVSTRPLNKEHLIVKGLHQPIVSVEEFNRVQSLFKSRTSNKVPEKYNLKNPLAGLIICKDCGHKMVRRPYKNGRMETILCSRLNCHNVSCDLDILEDRVFKSIQEHLKNYKTFIKDYEKLYEEKVSNSKSLINLYNKKLEQNKQQEMKICELLETGIYNLDIYNQRIEILKNEREEILLKIEKLKQELKENPTKTKKNSIPILEKAIQCYWDCTPQEKNDILKSIILKCIYKKEKSGRWNPEAIDNFELDIFFRI